MILALTIGGSLALGYALAECIHRVSTRRNRQRRKRESLLAEYVERQLWQFVSVDEWLEGNQS